jgi:signal transduction histidine kinase
MKKIFFSFYLFVIITFLSLRFVVSPLLDNYAEDYLQEHIKDYYRELVRGPFFITIEDLKRLPQEQWPQRMVALQPRFGQPVQVSHITEVPLDGESLEGLKAGEIAVDEEMEIFYQRVDDTAWVLTMGPFPDFEGKFYLLDVFVYGTVCVTLGLLTLIWAMPFWIKLKRIRAAAIAFGNGQFDTRAKVPKRSVLGSLAEAFNAMADRIESLIKSHKDLTNAVSHELRTPIARVKFGIEMLKGAANKKNRINYMNGISTDIDEIESLVAELLTYAKFDRESPTVDLKEHALEPLLESLAERIDPDATPVKLVCAVSDGAKGRMIPFEPHFMERALGNLVRNAARYAASQVEVGCEFTDQEVLIHVDDDGPGIPVERRESIFKPFVRLDTSRDRKSGGYGLGLAIVSQIAAWHGGRVEISDAPLGGARFTIRWPHK